MGLKFISFDATCDEIPKFHFIGCNEIPDTQPFEIIKVKDGEAFILKVTEVNGNFQSIFEKIDKEDYNLLKDIFNLEDRDGVYHVHCGHYLFTNKLI